MKRFTGIGKKIFTGFFVLIVIFLINSIITYMYLSRSGKDTEYISKVNQPSLVAIGEYQLTISKSKNYINSWVKIDIEDHEDKKALRGLISSEYPANKKKLESLIEHWENKDLQKQTKAVMEDFNKVVLKQDEIMKSLSKFDDYQDVMKKIEVEGALETVNQDINKINAKLSAIQTTLKKNTEISQESMLAGFDNLKNVVIVLTLVLVVLGFVIAYLISRSIIKPVEQLKQLTEKLGEGELPEKIVITTNDEIGDMTEGMNMFVESLKNRTEFASQIGNGVYDHEFELLGEHDVMGNALIDMRNNLKKNAEEDQRRNWANIGAARLGDVLRANYENNEIFYDETLKFIVKYLEANQGALFVIDSSDSQNEVLRLEACYAYDRKKFLSMEIAIGEGLVGQCYLEKETIFLTDVPDSYLNITSGLGTSNPRCVLIVPLKINEDILGIIEIASFKVFEEYQIKFIEKLSETIASSISNIKVNAHTKKLLEDAQTLTEQLSSQEEEMRQNMEELQATQEESYRREQKLMEEIEELKSKVN